MKLKVFAVFDSKVLAFTTPFFQRTSGEATRAFADAVNKEGSNFKSHAEDYTLFELGSWDDATAVFDMLETPHSLGLAVSYLRPVVPVSGATGVTAG